MSKSRGMAEAHRGREALHILEMKGVQKAKSSCFAYHFLVYHHMICMIHLCLIFLICKIRIKIPSICPGFKMYIPPTPHFNIHKIRIGVTVDLYISCWVFFFL